MTASIKQPVHNLLLTCPNKCSSQDQVLFGLQQHTTISHMTKPTIQKQDKNIWFSNDCLSHVSNTIQKLDAKKYSF